MSCHLEGTRQKGLQLPPTSLAREACWFAIAAVTASSELLIQ